MMAREVIFAEPNDVAVKLTLDLYIRDAISSFFLSNYKIVGFVKISI